MSYRLYLLQYFNYLTKILIGNTLTTWNRNVKPIFENFFQKRDQKWQLLFLKTFRKCIQRFLRRRIWIWSQNNNISSPIFKILKFFANIIDFSRFSRIFGDWSQNVTKTEKNQWFWQKIFKNHVRRWNVDDFTFRFYVEKTPVYTFSR